MQRGMTERQQKLYMAIKNYPESTCSQLGKMVGMKSSEVQTAIVGLETHGILLCEDNFKRITIYREVTN